MLRFIILLILFETVFCSKIITTSYGKLQGISEPDGKYMFKKIPFAKPPIGNLRFSLPEEPNRWEGILDATKYGPACLSNSSMTSTPQKFISEDCLYMNIFSSESCMKNKCPVIVYFHGGSFTLDSASMFPDNFILERYVEEGLIFVIPEFRLGVFGQLYLGENKAVPSNLFVYDSVQALKFVKQEISNFGGKNDDISLMGHSSGAQLVNSIGFSKQIDPDKQLFQKFIVLSAHGTFGYEEFQERNSRELARRLNCYFEDAEAIVSCLRKIDGLKILQTQRELEDNNQFYFRNIIQAPPLMNFHEKLSDFKKNPTARKLLCGVTEHEFEKYEYENNYSPTGMFMDFENPTDVVMIYRSEIMNKTEDLVNNDSSSVFISAATYSEEMVNSGGDVYLFETRQKPYSMHVSDMQYFVGIHREIGHNSDMDILDTFYSKLLVNFTKYGEPSPYWKKLDPSKMNFLAMEIDTKLGIVPTMEDGFHENLINLWMIDMIQLDGNITQKKKRLLETLERTTSLTVEYEIQDRMGILNQWWLYIIVLFIFIGLIILFIVLKRSTNNLYQPIPSS